MFNESDASNKEDDDQDTELNSEKVFYRHDIKNVSTSVIWAMVYTALNLDDSDFQYSHLIRFIREGRLCDDCIKFIPKELDVGSILWRRMSNRKHFPTVYRIRSVSFNLFKQLDLGKPNVPNMRNILERFVKELCLPEDFKDIVFSLMHKIPFKDFLLEAKRIVNFESVAMAYIVIALKIAFGLDDEYEVTISDAVEKINECNNAMKAYKFDMFEEKTDRLFSFREWANFLMFRKMVLVKYYFPFSIQYKEDADDVIFLLHNKNRYKKETASNISDDVTMDILRKISSNCIIDNSKINFPPTLTPHSDYIDIITSHITDPDLRLLLSEDFTRYSLKYAIKNFNLIVDGNNLIVGVNEIDKLQVDDIESIIFRDIGFDHSMVYVRNCENKNWLKTKPPRAEHITKIDDKQNESDKDSDVGYDSNSDSKIENVLNMKTDDCQELTEEELGKNIFHDDELEHVKIPQNPIEHRDDIALYDEVFHDTKYEVNSDDNLETISDNDKEYEDYDISTFDRNEAIKQLVLLACRKYKIPVPIAYRNQVQRKRKLENPKESPKKSMEGQQTKRTKIYSCEVKKDVEKLIQIYQKTVYENMIEERGLHDLTNNLVQLTAPSHSEILSINQSINQSDPIDKTQGEISAINFPEDRTPINHDLTDSILSENDITAQTEEDEEVTTVDNPNFDEEIYDIKQLYIKFKETEMNETSLEIDDDLDTILCKAKNNSTLKSNDADEDLHSEYQHENSESNETHNVQKRSKRTRKLKKNTFKEVKTIKDPLIPSGTKIKKFGYWIRHYRNALHKKYHANRLFDLEVLENFPKSFNLILNTCAAISECPMLDIYKNIYLLEKKLLQR